MRTSTHQPQPFRNDDGIDWSSTDAKVEAALLFPLEQLSQPATMSAGRREELRAELTLLETELARYAAAIADAGPLATILQAIRVRALVSLDAFSPKCDGSDRFPAPVERPRDMPPQKGPGGGRNSSTSSAARRCCPTFRGVNFCKFGGGPNGTRSNSHNSSARFHCPLTL